MTAKDATHRTRGQRRDYMESPDVRHWTDRVVAQLVGSRGRMGLPRMDRAALLAVDLQRIFVDPGSPAFVPAWQSARHRFDRLLEAARSAGAPVYWTRHVHPPGDDGGTIGHFFGRLLTEADPLAAFGRGYGPGPDERDVVKARHSVFSGSELGEWLARAGVRTVVLAGVRAELCVLASAVDASSLGFVPVVALDAVAGASESAHVAALAALAEGLAHVALTEEIITRWVETSGKEAEEPVGRAETGKKADGGTPTGAEPDGGAETGTAGGVETEPAAERARDLLIVGAGPAGVAAAFQARRDGLDVVLVGDERPGGLVRAAGPMANVPGFETGITGAALAERLEAAVRTFDPDTVKQGRVVRLSRGPRLFSADWVESGQPSVKRTVVTRAVVLATGTEPVPFDTEGWRELAGDGRAHRDARTLAQALNGKTVLVIGGGDAAVDTALTARTRGARAVVTIRGPRPTAAAHLVRAAQSTGVELRTRTSLLRIEPVHPGASRAWLDGPEGPLELEFHEAVACVGRRPQDHLLKQLAEASGSNPAGDAQPEGLFLAGDLAAGLDRYVHGAMGDGQRAACKAREFLKTTRSGHPDS